MSYGDPLVTYWLHMRAELAIRSHRLRNRTTRPTTARATTGRQFAYAGSKRRGL